jgi:hypothetical protein
VRQRRQPLGHRIAGQIRAGYLIPFVGKHFGNTAHTGATDADEVDATHAAHFRDNGTQFCQFNLGHSSFSIRGHKPFSFGDTSFEDRSAALASTILAFHLVRLSRWRSLALIGNPFGGIDDGDPARSLGHVQQGFPAPGEPGEARRQTVASLGLGQELHGRTAVDQGQGVAGLVIVHRMGQGTKMAATPAAATSETVNAPARHTRSAQA